MAKASRAPRTPDEHRAVLRELGERREQQDKDAETLRKDTAAALQAAHGIVPVNEAAKLVGLGRATVYQDYLIVGSDGEQGPASRTRAA